MTSTQCATQPTAQHRILGARSHLYKLWSSVCLPVLCALKSSARSSVLLLASCGEAPEALRSMDTTDEYPVGLPSIGASFSREFGGQVHAARYVEFRARHRGVIERLGVDEGERVQEGQLLFAIGAQGLKQELARARAATASASAEWRAAEVEVQSSRSLLESKVISTTELAVAEARLRSLAAKRQEAEAVAKQAKLNLSLARVHAPFSGVVNRIHRKVGSLVLEDELLTTLADTAEVLVYFRVSEQEYLALVPLVGVGRRQPVSLKLANGEAYAHEGVIDAVESEFDRASGTLSFRARFPNPEGLLRHGASAQVVLLREDPSAIVVPLRSTFEVQEKLYVYTVAPSGQVRATQVTPGARCAGGVVIERGLDPQDRVVLEGAQRLRDGERIVPRAPALVGEGR